MIHPLANVWGEGNIPESTKVSAFCDIGEPKIGENCNIQCHVSIPPGWKIGNNVFIGPGVRFVNDLYPQVGIEWKVNGGVVEDNVSIGCGAIILPVRIGNGALIGAGSVVVRDIPKGVIVRGNPARTV
jgi:acetyltransferase-like isoleucine patch superfamily enzyme